MRFFEDDDAEHLNLLPEGGTVLYYPDFLNSKAATHYFQHLRENIAWKPDEVILFGKRIITKREAAWYGDKAFEYTYSKTTKTALPWTRELLELRDLVQEVTQTPFNSCLLNLYHSGEEGMSWHSDNEKPLGEQPCIASLSLGAERKFSFKHKHTKQTLSFTLANGGLLIMKDETQQNWLHALPKTKKVREARINLTFRNFTE